jgi:putative hemolysin
MSGIETLYLVLLIACLVLSAFFSSSETAFISLQRIRIEQMVNAKVRGAKRVARMVEQPEKLLSTILLGNNFVNTAAAALATALAIRFWPEEGVLISTIVVTIVLLIFCETTPKTMPRSYP